MQNWTALSPGPREVGISLYYPIQMPLVQPRKWKNGYTFQSVHWADCGNAALVAFQDSCQLLRNSMSALASEAEIYRQEPVRFGLRRCFKQNRAEKVFLEQQANTTAACNTNSSLPFPAFRAAENKNSPLAALGRQSWTWNSKRKRTRRKETNLN